jgi:hypothetical protein
MTWDIIAMAWDIGGMSDAPLDGWDIISMTQVIIAMAYIIAMA